MPQILFFPEPAVLLDEILDLFCCSAGLGDELFDKILKVGTIEKCEELNSTSLKNNIMPVASVGTENFTYLSVYHGKKHYSARLKRFIMFTKETCLLGCKCCNRKINCIHKAMAMCFLKETEQLSRPWSQTIVN